MMNNTMVRMREQQELARAEQRAADWRVDASAWALAEVRTAFNFSVDTVNRGLLFTNFLEKEGKINRPQIIRFLLDHARNIERTWDNMQTLVSNIRLAEEQQPT